MRRVDGVTGSASERPAGAGSSPAARSVSPHHPERQAALDALRQFVAEMAGRKLPGERELAKRLSISRQHLRVLLDHLEYEGVVLRRQGSGTYAADARDSELRHVGLLIDARLKLGNDPFFSLLTERIQLSLQAADIHCVVERTDGTTRPRFVGEGMISLGLAGLEALSRLKASDPPAVSLFVEEPPEMHRHNGRVSLLLAEDRGAGYAAARRAMVEGGCRHLLFCGRGDLPASRMRWEGTCQAAAQGIEGASVTAELFPCSMNYMAGRAAAQTIAVQFDGRPLDGVGLIAANDWLAVGLRSGFAEVASPLRNVPLYSFDGLPVAEDPNLNIRSLKFPFSLMVEDTLAELHRLIRQRGGRVIRYSMEWADGWQDE